MVTPEESQTYWNTSNSNHMAFLQPERNHSMPFFPSGLTSSNLAGLNTIQENTVKPLLNNDSSYGTENPYLKDMQNPVVAPKKRFIIFDHSGNQTRLFFSPSFSARESDMGHLGEMGNANTRTVNVPFNETGRVIPKSANGPFGEMGMANRGLLMESITEEKWDENHPTDEECEDGMMLEDSKEIDALFYSDSDHVVDDDDGVDDEVTSPFNLEEGYDNEKDTLVKELITEQLGSSDSSPKKRKLLNGEYNKSPGSISSYDDEEIDSSKRENKVKIRRALKVLESIIPGLKGTDPLSIIDQAIAYLKSMRIEAKALGLSYPRGESPISL